MAAEFIASDSSLFIYRRFGAFAAQRLAMMQLELSRLERQWRDLDNECKVRHDGEPENDYNERKRKLKRLGLDIGDKLERYRMSLRPLAKSLCWYRIDKAMLLQSRICALESAGLEVVASLRNWYEGEEYTDEEYEFLEHVDDLVALDGREGTKDWLQKILERNFATWYPLRLKRAVSKLVLSEMFYSDIAYMSLS
jgi:hypothetical protein